MLQLASVQFHLINTFILFLSREGCRRGCLRAQQSSASPELVARNVLAIASLSIALGVPITLCTCGVALRGNGSWRDPYAHAIYLQGMPRRHCKPALSTGHMQRVSSHISTVYRADAQDASLP